MTSMSTINANSAKKNARQDRAFSVYLWIRRGQLPTFNLPPLPRPPFTSCGL